MSILEILWKWFDGKKVIIGSTLLLIAVFVRMVRPEYSQLGEALGGMFTAVGLFHKGVKAFAE